MLGFLIRNDRPLLLIRVVMRLLGEADRPCRGTTYCTCDDCGKPFCDGQTTDTDCICAACIRGA